MASSGTISPWTLGINLSGAEYGDPSTGVMYWNYVYPTNQELDHYALEGAKVVRIPLSMERLQPTPGGALDTMQLSYLDALVTHAAADGLQTILDPHNFGYAYGVEIGSTAASNTAFADFWSKMAAHYASSPNVIFGLMNEPHTQAAAEWLTSANLAISAIRQTGATQEVLVPGTWFDGAATWLPSGSAAALANGIVDPAHNYAIEVHEYLDSDGSGTHSNVVSATIGVERLQDVTQWAESTGNRLFLGEFGVASDALSLQALSNTLTYMQAHSAVWQGGTYWAAGPWMSSYMFSAETSTGTDTPQMTVLRGFMSLPAQAVTSITIGLANDTGSSNSDRITSSAQLTGSGDAGATVTIRKGPTVLGTTTADSAGHWSYSPSSLSSGSNTLTATETDTAGNSEAATISITLDTIAPAPALVIITGISGGGVTLAGMSEANSTVTVTDTSNGTATTVGTVTTGSNGAWSLTSHVVVDTTKIHTYTTSSTDAAGNTGAMSGSFYLASTGNDTLTGHVKVSDVFAIMSFKGSDIINGFEASSVAGVNHDYIDFSGRGITSFSQVQSMMSGSTSTILNIGSGKTIMVSNISPTTFTAADFRYS